jgi:hypothetical protein
MSGPARKLSNAAIGAARKNSSVMNALYEHVPTSDAHLIMSEVSNLNKKLDKILSIVQTQ